MSVVYKIVGYTPDFTQGAGEQAVPAYQIETSSGMRTHATVEYVISNMQEVTDEDITVFKGQEPSFEQEPSPIDDVEEVSLFKVKQLHIPKCSCGKSADFAIETDKSKHYVCRKHFSTFINKIGKESM
jgi:hypothetical protein